jgi:hypothetical protein
MCLRVAGLRALARLVAARRPPLGVVISGISPGEVLDPSLLKPKAPGRAGDSRCLRPTLLGTDRDENGIPWALLASERDRRLEFAGPAILNPPRALRAALRERMVALAIAKPPLPHFGKRPRRVL